jgi:predicted transcriptional regulator
MPIRKDGSISIARGNPSHGWQADDVSFTNRELDIMNVLWDCGPSTVSEVRDALPDELAYNTVLTMLRLMEGKGYVAHEEEGRAHRFRSRVERRVAHKSALKKLVQKLFDGSAELLLLKTLEDHTISKSVLR